jgi:dihydrofolate reductase
MRDIIYIGSISVDGYIDAADGDSRWVVPDPELHRHFNELESSVGAHLYGRRMYELMAEFWPTADVRSTAPDYLVEYARIWRAMPKVVFSKTLFLCDAHHRRRRDAHLPQAEQTHRSHPRRSPAVHGGGDSPQVPPR